MSSKKEIMIKETGGNDMDRYEKLLVRRDDLRKQAEQNQIEYFKVFGDLLVESYTARVECIRKKKMITYCQMCINRGKKISGAALDHFIEGEMTEYKEELDAIIRHNRAVKEGGTVSEYDVLRVKKLYRGLAKLIHPDLHPSLEGDKKIMEFWQRIVIAYEHNQMRELEELDFQVRKYLEGRGEADMDMEIPDLSAKIKRVEEEIEQIRSTEPYLYRLLLDDKEATESKKKELSEEIKSYTEYAKQLDEVISRFSIERNYS